MMKCPNEPGEHRCKRFKNDFYRESFDKSKIYNLEFRKKPAELVRKDLISAMKLPDNENLERQDYLLILDSWREEWEKGVQVPVNPDSLPQTNVKPWVKYDDNPQTQSSFVIPKKYIIHQNSSDDNKHNSNYELDLQDVCWLEALKESDLALDLPENFLEDTINELEQQCARNIKDQQIGIEYDDDIVCEVCQSPEGEDGNEMVFCDLCNICVHQACYGIQTIPEGNWMCKPCRTLGVNEKKALCMLCPNVGGALKPTTKPNKWAHVSCVFLIPEARFLNHDLLEPVETKHIPNWRWNTVCSLCKMKKGAPVVCDEKNCKIAYHVTCAFKEKLKVKIVLTGNKKSTISLKSYCLKHSKDSQKKSDQKITEIDFFTTTENENTDNGKQGKEKKNSQCEFWRYVVVNEIYKQMAQKYLNLTESSTKNCFNDSNLFQQTIDLIYQYWKLKRISNYGNSLIKLTFAEKFQEHLKRDKTKLLSLRYHMERLRTLSYMVCQRERIKCNWVKNQKELIPLVLNLADDPSPSESFGNFSSEHQKLFSKVISHNNIYPPSMSIGDITPPVPENDEESSQNGTTTTLNSKKNIIRSKSSSSSITNQLIRDIKRLKCPKTNPYAKVYLNLPLKRKGTSVNDGSEAKNDTETSTSNQPEKSDDNTLYRQEDSRPIKSQDSSFHNGYITIDEDVQLDENDKTTIDPEKLFKCQKENKVLPEKLAPNIKLSNENCFIWPKMKNQPHFRNGCRNNGSYSSFVFKNQNQNKIHSLRVRVDSPPAAINNGFNPRKYPLRNKMSWTKVP